MSNGQSQNSSTFQSNGIDAEEDLDLAQVLKELSKGEQTATMMENQLSAIEAKIEELLASATEQHVTQGGSASGGEEANEERKS